MYARIYFQQFSGRPSLDNEVRFTFVPVDYIVSPSSQPRTLLSCRVPFHVFIFLSFVRAHVPQSAP